MSRYLVTRADALVFAPPIVILALVGGLSWERFKAARFARGWSLALFKAMLIAVWYDLSDVRLAEALDDRASFRRFCGFSAHEPTPERTAFGRLRAQLVARGLDHALFDTVTRQLRAKAVTVKPGQETHTTCWLCWRLFLLIGFVEQGAVMAHLF